MRVNQAANSTQNKTLQRGFCRDCGFSAGFPRPHRARRTWSKPGCCQSGCLTISHNCGLHYLDSNQAQHPALRLVSYSRRAHYFAEQPAISCARRTIAIPASAIPVVCSFYRQKPRRQHLCIVERLLDFITVDYTALTNSGYWTIRTCCVCIVIHQAIAMQSQLCAPYSRSNACGFIS